MEGIDPNIVTRFRIGKFIFDVYAYRKVTESEAQYALNEWLRARKRKNVPKKWHVKAVTIFGFGEE